MEASSADGRSLELLRLGGVMADYSTLLLSVAMKKSPLARILHGLVVDHGSSGSLAVYGLIVPSGCDSSASVVSVGAGFHGPGCCIRIRDRGCGAVSRGRRGRGAGGSPSATRSAQGDRVARWSRTRRPVRASCGGDGEDPVAEPFRFPPSGLVAGEGEQLHPGGEFGGEADQGAPDPVLVEVVQRQVGQAGVFGVADPVLGAGPAAVPQLQVGQLARRGCWWRTR